MIGDVRTRMDGFVPTHETVWALRGDVLAIRTVLEGKSEFSKRQEAIERTMVVSDLCEDILCLLNDLRRDLTAKGYTQLATLFDMATVGSLAINDLMDGKWKQMKDLVTGTISMGTIVLGSMQYIRSSDQVLLAMVEGHICKLYGRMWSVIMTRRKGLSMEQVQEARKGLDSFFDTLRDDRTSMDLKILTVVMLYSMLIKLACERLMEIIDDKALGI